MNRFFKAANAVMLGPPLDPNSRELLVFDDVTLTISQSHQGVLILGSPGRGKTTTGKSYLLVFFRRGFGGVYSVVKPAAANDFMDVARHAKRQDDVVRLAKDSPHRFNPFREITSPADCAALLGEISDLIQATHGASNNGSTDGYWHDQRDILLYHLCVIAQTCGTLDAGTLKRLIDGLPTNRSESLDPGWREISPLARAIASVVSGRSQEFSEAVVFVTEKFPGYPDKTQGSIRSMADAVLHHLCRSPLSEIFGGESTISMEEVVNHRKLLLVDLPAAGSLDGKIANLLVIYCFCRAAKSIPRHADAFLYIDECQELPCKELMRSLALFREYRVSPVLLTQNLGTLNAGLGKQNGEALCELLATIIALGQEHADTREWLTKHIGKAWKHRYAETTSNGKRSTTSTRELTDKVHATEFAELKVGESICCYAGKHWKAKWPAKLARGSGSIRIGK